MLGILLALLYYHAIHPTIVLKTVAGYTFFMTSLLTSYSWLIFDLDSQLFYLTYVFQVICSKKSRAV